MRKYIIYMVALSIIEISLAFYLTEWRHVFWDYVEKRNYNGFLLQIGIFTGVALVLCFVASYAQYFGTRAAIKWRETLNLKSIYIKNSRELNANYGNVPPIENLNQRIQEDCMKYPDLMIQVVFGFGKAILYVLVFSISLVMSYNYIYLTIILTYAILSTIVAKRISKPLISLNYESQRAEATYRNNLTVDNFSSCIDIMLGLAAKTKRLTYFQTFYGQIAVILPIVIVAPAYFSAALTLGGLMQCTGTMSTISENMSYGINSFSIINRLISCRKRLMEVNII